MRIDLIIAIKDSLDEPSQWSIGEFYLINHRNNYKIWIANGLFFIRIDGHPSFTLLEKIAIYPKIRKLIGRLMIKKIYVEK